MMRVSKRFSSAAAVYSWLKTFCACSWPRRTRIAPITPAPTNDSSAARREKIAVASRFGSVEPTRFALHRRSPGCGRIDGAALM